MFEHIDLYCERTGPEFWSEPINALTNLAFILAAATAVWLWRRDHADDRPALLLIAIICAIGTGSFLFHTYATLWAMLADVIPITIFIYVYFFLAMRRMVGLGVAGALGVTVAFFAASYVFGAVTPRGFLYGSGSYLPAWAAIVAVGLMLHRRGHPAAPGLLAAGVVLAVSLTFRTLDQPLCDAIPIGTHFLWHTLNGVVLLMLTVTFMRARSVPQPRAA